VPAGCGGGRRGVLHLSLGVKRTRAPVPIMRRARFGGIGGLERAESTTKPRTGKHGESTHTGLRQRIPKGRATHVQHDSARRQPADGLLVGGRARRVIPHAGVQVLRVVLAQGSRRDLHATGRLSDGSGPSGGGGDGSGGERRPWRGPGGVRGGGRGGCRFESRHCAASPREATAQAPD
jgi:hypothetical protein